MSDENNSPSVDEIRAQVEKEVAARYQSQFEEEKTKIIGNRDQILAEKKAIEEKFKNFDEDKYKGYQDYLKRMETDEELKLLSEGKIEDVLNKRLSGREKAWNETQAEYENRLKASQTEKETLANELEGLKKQNYDMTVRNFLKDLVAKDDSFNDPYFDEFKAIYGPKVDVDLESGKVYALGQDGKRIIDTNGDFVPFDKFYAKQKVDSGLFWKGGAGSGIRGQGSNGDMLGGDPTKWTSEQRNEFITQHGYKAYSDVVAKNARKK